MSQIRFPGMRLFTGLLLLTTGGWEDCGGMMAPDDPQTDTEPVPMSIVPAPVSFISAVGPFGTVKDPVAGDFDGDGILDFAGAVQNRYWETRVMRGKGDGTFPGSMMAPGGYPASTLLRAADFNRDGKTDLVLVTGMGGTALLDFYVGLSNGTSFIQSSSSAARGPYAALIAGDLDGDKLPDILWSYDVGNTKLFKGNGFGIFNVTSPPYSSEPNIKMWSADADGDGTIDLVVTLRGNTNTIYAGGAVVTLDQTPRALVIADFNRDRVLDIAIGMGASNLKDAELRVMLGKGAYSLDPPIVTTIPAGLSIAELASADFDRDGILDLAVEDKNGLGIMLGKGDGSFRPPASYYEGSGKLLVTDLNKDGTPDLVCPEIGYSILGDGHGGLLVEPRVPGRDTLPGIPVGGADFNNDGKMDVLLAGEDVLKTVRVAALLYQGGGKLLPTTPMDLIKSRHVAGSATGDFNGDGKIDAVISTWTSLTPDGEIHMLLGKGDGTFQAPLTTLVMGLAPPLLAAADLNKDGHLDLVITGQYGEGVGVLLGNGDGTLRALTIFPANFGPVASQLSDVDNDGNLDVVVINHSGSPGSSRDYDMISVLRGKGDGTLKPPLATDLFSSSSEVSLGSWVGANDWDHDGKIDLVLCGYTKATVGPPTSDWKGLRLFRGNGRGGFVLGPLTLLPAATLTRANGCPVNAGDLNGDGEVDLVGLWQEGTSVMLSRRDGTFTPPTRFTDIRGLYYTSWQGPILADMNGDKKLDFIEFNLVRWNTTP